MNHPQFVIRNVAVLATGRLGLQFGDGLDAAFDLSEVIAKHPSLARLADPAVFRAVTPDEWNRGVIFADGDDLTSASDNLRAMTIEQTGQ